VFRTLHSHLQTQLIPVVTPIELTQVTDILALLAGVASTTPVVVSTWSTLLTTPSSQEGVFVVPEIGVVPAPIQRLSHTLGGPAALSRHMTAVYAVPGPVALPSGQGLSGSKALVQGETGEDVMEINEEHIETLTDSLRDNALLKDSSSNRDDGSIEIDHTCLWQLIDIVHLNDSEHKVSKPKRKQLKKKKSSGRQHGGNKNGQAGTKRKRRNQAEDLGSDH